MVAQVQIPFATSVLAVGVIIWVVVNWSYKSILTNKDSQIELLDRQLAEYCEKLKVGSPDEAAHKIAELELQLPRRLTSDQVNAIRRSIKPNPEKPWNLVIFYHRACHDCADYGRQLKEAMLGDPSWPINLSDFMGGKTEGRTGLFVGTDDLNNPSQAARMLADALNAAKLPYSFVHSLSHFTMGRHHNHAELFILPRY